MEKTEELERDIAIVSDQLKNLNDQLIIQKAINSFQLTDVKNNILDGVKLIETASIHHAKKFLLIFSINHKEFKIEINVDHSQVINNLITERLSTEIFKEISNQLKVN